MFFKKPSGDSLTAIYDQLSHDAFPENNVLMNTATPNTLFWCLFSKTSTHWLPCRVFANAKSDAIDMQMPGSCRAVRGAKVFCWATSTISECIAKSQDVHKHTWHSKTQSIYFLYTRKNGVMDSFMSIMVWALFTEGEQGYSSLIKTLNVVCPLYMMPGVLQEHNKFQTNPTVMCF